MDDQVMSRRSHSPARSSYSRSSRSPSPDNRRNLSSSRIQSPPRHRDQGHRQHRRRSRSRSDSRHRRTSSGRDTRYRSRSRSHSPRKPDKYPPHEQRPKSSNEHYGPSSSSRDTNPTSSSSRGGVSEIINRDGPSNYTWGKEEDIKEGPTEPVEKPNFGLSGALARDVNTGNMLNGIVLKFTEPQEKKLPTKRWRLYVFKNKEPIATLHLHRQSAYLIGREKKVADILAEHASTSAQHAVIQFRSFEQTDSTTLTTSYEVRPYILDLKSTHHTYLNGKKIEHSRYIELRSKDLLTFGASTREYIVMDPSDAKK